mmetsp:Transcript_25562/g.50344  ORF Transcript_25562/g.50344 Transcript_25562/m.50344 type:complete len:213 (+) Transcript_25562:3424-4062(+)
MREDSHVSAGLALLAFEVWSVNTAQLLLVAVVQQESSERSVELAVVREEGFHLRQETQAVLRQPVGTGDEVLVEQAFWKGRGSLGSGHNDRSATGGACCCGRDDRGVPTRSATAGVLVLSFRSVFVIVAAVARNSRTSMTIFVLFSFPLLFTSESGHRHIDLHHGHVDGRVGGDADCFVGQGHNSCCFLFRRVHNANNVVSVHRSRHQFGSS